MFSFFIIVFSVFALYSILSLIPTLMTYGKPIKDSDVIEFAKNNEFVLNNADIDIVMNKALYESFDLHFKGGAFYPINFTIFFKYHINGMGTVWRWSKGAKALDDIRAALVCESAH